MVEVTTEQNIGVTYRLATLHLTLPPVLELRRRLPATFRLVAVGESDDGSVEVDGLGEVGVGDVERDPCEPVVFRQD
ncbi:MAG TPA: hypothetical protein VK973_14620, partial [Arenicellales bacterium]|nr:hypothetical protein [Arenicellales bacterium]